MAIAKKTTAKSSTSKAAPMVESKSAVSAPRVNPAPRTSMNTDLMDSKYSLRSTIVFINQNFALIVLFILFFVGGFLVGSLWTENQMLRSGAGKGTGVAQAPTAPTQPGEEVKPPVENVPPVTDADHIQGNKNAKVVLVEYSDFECPFCARFHPTMEQVKAEFGDDVAWVYRHFPLTIHPNAQKAAEASECVAKYAGNDAFWKFADGAAEEVTATNTLSDDAITSIAESTGVNMNSFQTCLDTGEMTQVVKDSMSGGLAAGINGTPGTIIVTKDGGQELISGALPVELVKTTIENYLK
jgi:protein-disulfide isomerase